MTGKGKTQKTTLNQTMLRQDAIAYALELGYTFKHDWKPRASVFYGYGTGDKNSKDAVNGRFNSLYGFNQPWSRNDYFNWSNISTPKARIEFTPHKDLRIDAGYGAFWLASSTDPTTKAGMTSSSAVNNSGSSFVGHEFDIRLRHQLNPYVDWSVSYARFEPGRFTRDQARAALANGTGGPYTDQPSNFFYFEVTLNAFGDGKPIR